MSRTRTRRCLLFSLAALLATTAVPAVAQVDSRVSGQALIASAPTDPNAYLQYAVWLSENGVVDEAATVLETGRQKSDPSVELLLALGEAYEELEQVSRAEAVTRDALALDAEHVDANIRMGEIYMRLGWPKSGIECFAKAIELAPELPLPKVRLVGGLLEWGKVTEAEDHCLEFIAGDAENPELWLALGQVFERQNKLKEAFTTYGQVLSLDPDRAEPYARRGRLFCRFGQYQAGEDACRRALQLDADNLLAHAYLGIACSYLGRGDEARKHAEIAEAGGMNMTAVWKKLGK